MYAILFEAAFEKYVQIHLFFSSSEKKFARLVQHHILILAVWTVLSEEVFKPVKRGCLGDLCVAMLHLREVIGHKDPCGYQTIKRHLAKLFGLCI